MSQNKIKGIFFDFDGVLIDSLPAMKKGWEFVCSKYSINQDFKNYSKFIGIPFYSILENLNIEKKIHRDIFLDYFGYTNQRKNLIKLNPYVYEIIKWAQDELIKIAVVTSKNMQTTYSLIDYFQLEIDLIITPELTTKGKPDPEPILFAANKLSIECENILFVGDMQTDMICAKNAKCYYLHYLMGYQNIDIQEYGGEISSLLEIKEFVNFL